MKFAEKIFPKGTFPGQKTDGAYINETLANNLNVYAKKIVKDMHFLIIITGNDSVGNGKTTMATQVATYLTNKINETQGINNSFTTKNMAFKADDLVKQSFNNPPYSVLVLDEGDDLTSHAMKQSTMELKKYFRKCRQLNQILILILPSFFELPRFYALARSHALINVKFQGEFERGYFDFYGPNNKKKLYLKGKKDWDYSAAHADFYGSFFSSYCFFPNVREEVKLYKAGKHGDLTEREEEPFNKEKIILKTKQECFYNVYNKLDLNIDEVGEMFGIKRRAGNAWLHAQRERIKESQKQDLGAGRDNTNNSIEEDDEMVGLAPQTH